MTDHLLQKGTQKDESINQSIQTKYITYILKKIV